LLYVNERPFVLRDGDNPYINIEHTGINTRRLEAMERQLRRDILAEGDRMQQMHAAGDTFMLAASSPTPDQSYTVALAPITHSSSSDYRVLLHDEDENGNLIAVWHSEISSKNIQTPQMQFMRCFEEAATSVTGEQASDGSASGYRFTARYFRTPITDEQAPSAACLDDLLRGLETARDAVKPVLVFNCQMGRGRTTTGLIIACLWCIHRKKIDNYQEWLSHSDAKKPAYNRTGSESRSLLHSGASASVQPGVISPPSAPVAAVTTSTSSSYLAPSSIPGDDAAAVHKREDEFNHVRGGTFACATRLQCTCISILSCLSVSLYRAFCPTFMRSPACGGVCVSDVQGLRHGWYKVIQSLVRVLTDGPTIKRQVDRVIDQSEMNGTEESRRKE
jgi:protein-tyrosine phosphatase